MVLQMDGMTTGTPPRSYHSCLVTHSVRHALILEVRAGEVKWGEGKMRPTYPPSSKLHDLIIDHEHFRYNGRWYYSPCLYRGLEAFIRPAEVGTGGEITSVILYNARTKRSCCTKHSEHCLLCHSVPVAMHTSSS